MTVRHVITFTFRFTMPGEKAWVNAMGASTFSFKHLSQSVMSPAALVHNDQLEDTQACSRYGQVGQQALQVLLAQGDDYCSLTRS